MYHAGMMSVLPERTIPIGAHVSLDVRSGILCIVVAVEMSVICAEYVIHDEDVALEFFAYLEKHRSRFASVHIN